MKILRSVNRRGFSVGTAGYFTVLKPNTWFAATRLPDRFHHLNSRSRGYGGPPAPAPGYAESEPTIPSAYMKLSARDHGVMRPALIVLAASTITLILLLWIAHPV